MISLGVTTTVLIFLGIYAALLFGITVWKPRYGIYLLIPIIGLGFGASSLIKGGYIAIALLASLLHILITRRRLSLRTELLPPILLIALFAGWVLVRGLWSPEPYSFWLFWVLKRIAAPSVIVLLMLLFIQKEKHVRHLVWVLGGFAALTALVGILQYVLKGNFFWHIRILLGVPEPIAYQIFGKVRIAGLSSYVIPLAYQLLSVLPLVLSLTLVRTRARMGRLWQIAVVLLIFLCLIFTFVKASIGGAILGSVVVIVLLLRSRIAKLGMSAILLLSAVFISSFAIFNTHVHEKIFSIGTTTYERIPIALAAIKTFEQRPLGVGSQYSEYVKVIYPDISGYTGSRVALVAFPHNMLLNLLVILGLPALIIVLMFYIVLIKKIWSVAKRERGMLHTVAIGSIGSIIAYLFNTMFHNNSPFFGDAFGWLIIGLSLCMINIHYLSEKNTLIE